MKNWVQKLFLSTATILLLNFTVAGQTCDTLSNFTGNYQPAIIPIPAPGWGYVSGHNNFLETAKAEYFNYTGTNTQIDGVFLGFGYAFTTNPSSTITATVWDGTGGTPGVVLEQKDVFIQDIMMTLASLQPTYVEFDNSVSVPTSGEFFVGFTMTAGADTVAIVTSTPGNVPFGQGTAWGQQANGIWLNYNSPLSWQFDAAQLIFPTLSTPVQASFTPSNATACENVDITFDASSSSNAVTYDWFFPGGTPSSSTAAMPTVNYDSAGVFDVTLIVTNGCSSDTMTQSNIIEIVNYCPPTCDLVTTIATFSPSCNSGNDGFATTQTSGGTAPYTFAWSNGVTADTAFNLTTGNYTVTVTDANGCFVIASFGVGQPSQLAATGSNTAPTTCNGTDGTATATATGGVGNYTYLWNTTPAQTTATAINLSQGTYTCTVTDGNGCLTIVNVSVSDGCASCALVTNPIPTNASCGLANGTIDANVSGQTGMVTYTWSNGNTSPTISNLNSGTYSVTVTDMAGCQDSATVTLIQSGNVAVTLTGQDDFCATNGASISATLTGGASPYTYNWSNGDTTNTATNLVTGTYDLTVTDANGCTDISSIAVTSLANGPSIMTTQNNISCFGADDGTINMTVSGGNLPYTVAWSHANITAQNLNNLGAGSYTAVITDNAGCLATTTVIITQPDSITLVATSTPTQSNDGTAFVNAAGGTPPYSYAWNNGDTTQAINGLTTGTYSVVVTDASGCSATVNVTVQDFTSNTNGIESLTTFDILPNPNNGQFAIRLDFEEITKLQVKIVDMVGQVIFENNVTESNLYLPIDLGNQAPGVYFIYLQTETGHAVKRVLIAQ